MSSTLGNTECVICCDLLHPSEAEAKTNGDVAATLPCGHLFHFSCISHAINIKPQCPVCRKEVPRRERNEGEGASRSRIVDRRWRRLVARIGNVVRNEEEEEEEANGEHEFYILPLQLATNTCVTKGALRKEEVNAKKDLLVEGNIHREMMKKKRQQKKMSREKINHDDEGIIEVDKESGEDNDDDDDEVRICEKKSSSSDTENLGAPSVCSSIEEECPSFQKSIDEQLRRRKLQKQKKYRLKLQAATDEAEKKLRNCQERMTKHAGRVGKLEDEIRHLNNVFAQLDRHQYIQTGYFPKSVTDGRPAPFCASLSLFEVGRLVWALYDKVWYPAQVADPSNAPFPRLEGDAHQNYYLVCFVEDSSASWIKPDVEHIQDFDWNDKEKMNHPQAASSIAILTGNFGTPSDPHHLQKVESAERRLALEHVAHSKDQLDQCAHQLAKTMKRIRHVDDEVEEILMAFQEGEGRQHLFDDNGNADGSGMIPSARKRHRAENSSSSSSSKKTTECVVSWLRETEIPKVQ